MLRKTACLFIACVFTSIALVPLNEGANVILSGAGATFPYPLYEKWIDRYQQESGVRISYRAVGSGEGIRQIISRTVDFGATDAFMSEDEMARADGDILHVPTCLGAVAIIYHLPGKPVLRFSPKLLADIFSGKITRWSHEAISSVNPGIHMADMPITVVHRSEGSGTTFIFTDYLSKVDLSWRERIGRGKKIRWPSGMGVEGNPSVAELVKKIPGAIGYVELAYAKRNELPAAFVKNRSGYFVAPTLASVSAAAEVALPSDTRILITDTQAPDGYPISAFTWLIVYREQSYNQRAYEKAFQLSRFLWWAIHRGQQYTRSLLYAPLPRGAVSLSESIIRSMCYNGRPCSEESLGGLK